MRNFEMLIVDRYRELVKKSLNTEKLKTDDLLNPSDEVVKQIIEFVIDIIDDESKFAADSSMADSIFDKDSSEYEEEYSYFYSNTYYDYFIDVFRYYIVYNLIYPSENGYRYINLISQNNVGSLIDVLDTNVKLRNELVFGYVKYLVCKAEMIISEKQVDEVWSRNDFIEYLDVNKGYITLNDIARKVLSDLLNDAKAMYSEEQTYKIFDDFLNSSTKDIYLIQNGIDVSNVDYVRKLKNYFKRIILADAYSYLKAELQLIEEGNATSELGNFEEVSLNCTKAADYIEDVVQDENYDLPGDENLKGIIYHYFFVNLGDLDIAIRNSIDNDNLNPDESKVLRLLNPISDLD